MKTKLLAMISSSMLMIFFSSVNAQITFNYQLEPVKKLTNKEKQSISVAGGRILKHVEQTGIALQKKDKKAALENIEKGLTLVSIINNALPTYKVDANIKEGKLVYNDVDTIKSRYIELFDDTSSFDLLAPSQKDVKKNIKKHNLVIKDEEITETVVKLNIALIEKELEQAKAQLLKDKWKLALENISKIQNDAVIFEYIDLLEPLDKIIDNIRLGQLELKDNNQSAAKEAFTEAVSDLREYKQFASKDKLSKFNEVENDLNKLVSSLDNNLTSKEAVEKSKVAENIWANIRTMK